MINILMHKLFKEDDKIYIMVFNMNHKFFSLFINKFVYQ